MTNKNLVPLSITAAFILLNTVFATAQCASKSSAPWELWIKNLQFNTINYESEKFKDYSSLGYSDFTNVNTTLTKGQSYPLSITAGLSWSGILNNAYCRAWVDWNGNNLFEDSELVLEKTAQTPFTQNVSVPTTAATATVRLRIAVKSGGFPTPCETFGSGEVEDYTVTIAEPIGSNLLQITNAVAANAVNRGGTVPVTFTIKNRGSTPSSPSKTVKLSNGTSRSGKRNVGYEFQGFTNDVPIGIVIPPDSTRTVTLNFTLNADYSPQFTYLKPFERYPDGTYVGLSSANFFSSVSSSFDTFPAPCSLKVILPYADLAITMSTTTPIYAGKEVNYVVKIKNKSNDTVSKVEARLFNLGFYTFDSVLLTPSKGTTVSYNSVGEIYTVVGYWYTGTLAPNEEATCAVQLSAGYLGLDFGSGSMTADVQSLSRYDTITANNTASLAFRRDTVNKSDLTLTNLSTTPTVAVGQILNFKFDAKNIGTGNATNGFSIKSYLSADQILDANDYQNGNINTANYAARTNIEQIQGAMTVTRNFPIGQYYLILKIDADNNIRESNEDNNILISANPIVVAAPSDGTNDLALSLTSTPSVYRQYATQNFKISIKNTSAQAFTDVKIDFPFPAKTVSGGTVAPSIGDFQEWCAGGTQCFEWTIPSLAANTTATLEVPLYVLDAVNPIVATARLLATTPSVPRASATIAIGRANLPLVQPLIQSKPTALHPIGGLKVRPTLAENNVIVELESNIDKQVDFQIINPLGTVVLSTKLSVEKGNNAFNFNIQNLPKGLYFIQTEVGKGRNMPAKFIKL